MNAGTELKYMLDGRRSRTGGTWCLCVHELLATHRERAANNNNNNNLICIPPECQRHQRRWRTENAKRLCHENQPSDSGNDDDDDAFEVRTGRLTRSLRSICVSCRSRSFHAGTNVYAHRVTSNDHERRNGPYFALFHRIR